ncbi:hypothetical protein LOK49_LG04G00202 [Camellia lanceoleosa]|uniref:Uncharacterized protein n=1 Tax=Camellia lanceoleosa TaxID=1840588 RepID=A0ACC0I201_9ERIC|nr:hypothetical protein LOK49_LG04G00202 [Camellia lanceoleosa]
MADINSARGELVHGGQFIKHNICGHIFEITAEYRPPIMPFGCGSAYGIVCLFQASSPLLPLDLPSPRLHGPTCFTSSSIISPLLCSTRSVPITGVVVISLQV